MALPYTPRRCRWVELNKAFSLMGGNSGIVCLNITKDNRPERACQFSPMASPWGK